MKVVELQIKKKLVSVKKVWKYFLKLYVLFDQFEIVFEKLNNSKIAWQNIKYQYSIIFFENKNGIH